MRILGVVVSLQLILLASGFMFFQEVVPNGNHIPNPCFANHLWHGLGHENSNGGGKRNPFGRDFEKNDNKYNATLCRMDSDHDNRTNGEELGDPDCTWTKGSIPKRTTGLTHPGICEPLDNEECQKINNWEVCQSKEWKCPDVEEEGVQNITLRFNRTAVPPTVTNYYCMSFDLPSDRPFHIVATKPELDNKVVMHHLLLYGCDDPDDEVIEAFRTPKPCSMMARGDCNTMIAGWTVGALGSCNDGLNAGFRIGKGSFTKAVMEFHWNNPQMKAGMWDSSGLTLFFTPKLREYDQGTLTLGQMGLHIPPNADRATFTAKCKGSCTKGLKRDLHIVSTLMHMHYLGVAGHVDQYRDKRFIRTLAKDDVYHYDSPVSHRFDPPATFQPGDSLEIQCVFSSPYRTGFTYYGDGTQDEMCFAFINYYPKADFDVCVQFGMVDTCRPEKKKKPLPGECDLHDWKVLDDLYLKVGEYCDDTGETCKPKCREFLLQDPHPCLKGDEKLLLDWTHRKDTNLTRASRSCDMLRQTLAHSAGTVPGDLGGMYLIGAALMVVVNVLSG